MSPMWRTLWLAAVAIPATLLFATTAMLIAMVKSTSPWIDRAIRVWARILVRAAGVDLHTENIERIDRDKRYILVANHYSYLDIPCLLAAVPQPLRFMAKVSLFKIPIFGWALDRTGFIPIDRQNRRTAVKSFELAVDRIRKGNTIVVFPEEGRSREREMRPFQRGAFLLAIRSQKTVLPVAIDSTFDIWPPGKFWDLRPGRVTVRIGTPIETASLTVREKDRILNESRDQVQAMLFGSPPPPVSDPAPAASAHRP